MARRKRYSAETRRKRARLQVRASRCRNKCLDPRDRFEPIHYIENVLNSEVANFDYHYVEALEYGGLPVEARVRFDWDGKVLLVRERVLLEARAGLAQARFSLAHEIAHAILHHRPMMRRIEGASLPRGRPGDNQSFIFHSSNAEMEVEANLFAGLLLIPLEAISVRSDPKWLSDHYGTSPIVAEKAKEYALEVWSTIQEIKINGR